ncbi:alpha/beta-hydrolase [Penicillium verhagenii]|uniref:alpha/beta-hydrolase n=1 Tax=Penicillium verhagenii TaxID=1562060 RepID=UPI0025455097|nr:alpha/beta-hydrolase [Penicillium verhagenii]KAJ5935568.1 alpha/beta-hydrolase [Penicillium verhagenii]
MDKFKKWRRKQKSATDVSDVRETTHLTRSSTASEEPPPPRNETDPPLPAPHQPSSLKFGLKLLHDCPNADVDICFVHGLTGDRDKTWIAVGQTTPWPKLLLPSKLNARLLMYGYDAHVTRKSVASSNRLINHAQNLLGDLTADRSICNASSRPFIFVAHSLGGLVCKKAILLSQNAAERESRALFDCLEGIAFMGTPHKGAWMADWAKIPASVFGLVKSTNVTLLDILQRDNQLLNSIQLDFLTMIRRLRESGRGIGVTCFFEELPFPVVGRIVTEESATLDGYEIYSIYANHRDMVRFGSEEDPGFKRLLWKLLAWTPQVGKILHAHCYRTSPN